MSITGSSQLVKKTQKNTTLVKHLSKCWKNKQNTMLQLYHIFLIHPGKAPKICVFAATNSQVSVYPGSWLGIVDGEEAQTTTKHSKWEPYSNVYLALTRHVPGLQKDFLWGIPFSGLKFNIHKSSRSNT